MQTDNSHYKLAEKFALLDVLKKTIVTDSLLKLLQFAYTEEEAMIASALGVAPLPASAIAIKVRRPLFEVRRSLESLSERFLILGIEVKGLSFYAFLPMVPGVFEAQMLRSRKEPDQKEYFQRFAQLFNDMHHDYSEILQPLLADRDLRLSRIIPINKSISASPGIIPLSTDNYEELADRNSTFALLEACACRTEHLFIGEGCGKPLDVCTCLGWVAELLIKKGLARRISKQAFLEVKARATEAGLVQLTDNIRDPLQVCSCCTCCCTGLSIVKQHNLPGLVARSHFEAQVDESRCTGCKKCLKICPMDAIGIETQKARVDVVRCIGCGLCVGVCDKVQAMTLREREGHQEPAGGLADFLADRYQEIMGDRATLGTRITLGAGRLLSKISPVSLSGPKYKSPKS
jgi:Na+-translocating ferredoxin:NAD+ oxidoreductase subunit B